MQDVLQGWVLLSLGPSVEVLCGGGMGGEEVLVPLPRAALLREEEL
jgi:hypothetical protein